MGLLVALIVGGLAGWLASLVAGRDSSLGVVGNVVVGFLGGVLANFLLGRDDALSNPTWAGFLFTVLGAVVLLVLVNLFTRRSLR